VLLRREGAVAVLTLNRPQRLNALTVHSYREITAALAGTARDDTVAVVLLEGAGRGFCSGADLDALRAMEGDTAELTAAFEDLVTALVGFPKPLVAAVHGVAVGLGVTMLLHCDLVVVAADARLRLPFTALGTAPEAASSWLLPLLAGAQRAADLLLTSRWFTGTEAVRLGLAARSTEEAELRSEALALAQEVAALPREAVAAAKLLLRQGWAQAARAAMDRELAAAHGLRALLGPLGAPAPSAP